MEYLLGEGILQADYATIPDLFAKIMGLICLEGLGE